MNRRQLAITLMSLSWLGGALRARADLTLEAAKAVHASPPGNATQFPVEVHIIITGICTIDASDSKVIVPAHTTASGSIPAHEPYLMFETANYVSGTTSDDTDTMFTNRAHKVYTLNNEEVTISAIIQPEPFVSLPDQGGACPAAALNLSTHWVPKLSAALTVPASVDLNYTAVKPDKKLVAGVLKFASAGQLNAHVLDSRLYEFKDVGGGRTNLVQAVAQVVDYTFRISGNLTLNIRNYQTSGVNALVLKPVSNAIYIKLGNTPKRFLAPPVNPAMPMPGPDEHFTLHYDMVTNPGNRPIPTAIGTCFYAERVNCSSGSCQLQPLMLEAQSTGRSSGPVGLLSLGGLDCGPDGLP